jgi:hypothetical protein
MTRSPFTGDDRFFLGLVAGLAIAGIAFGILASYEARRESSAVRSAYQMGRTDALGGTNYER